MLGEAMRIRGVFADCQRRIVVEDAPEYVSRLARRAGDRLRGVDAALVGRVRVKCERSFVVAEVARIEAGQEAIPLDREALAIGGGASAVAPDEAELQAVMVIDQNGVGRLERGVAQEPSAGVLQRLGGEGVDALAHRGETEVGAVPDQGGEQRAVRIGAARLVTAEGLEGTGEAAPFIDVLQQVLDAHAWQAGANGGAQFMQRARNQHRISPFELEPAIANLGKAVGGHAALRGPRRPVKLGAKPSQECLPVNRQVKTLVGLFTGLLPLRLIVNQVPEGYVVAALRQEQAAGAERVTDRKGERDFPDGAIQFAAGLVINDEMGPPVSLHEGVRIIRCQRAARAGVQRTQDLDCPEKGFVSGSSLEWQGEERRQVLAQRAIARDHCIEMTAGLQPLVSTAGNCRLDQGGSVHHVAESTDRLLLVGFDQGVDAVEHTVQSVAGAAAQAFAAQLDRRTRPTVHPGQEQVIHLDDLIEQRRAGLHQIAGNQCVTLGLGEAAEIARIIAASKLAQLADDLWIETAQLGSGSEQFLDQVQADDVALDHRGVG